MQFIDIAVASGYAAVCLSLIVFMNPVASQQSAVGYAAEASLDRVISAYIGQVGISFLADAPLSAVCSSAEGASNSTVGIDVSVAGQDCGFRPSLPPLASSSFSLDLGGSPVVIDAWLARR